jgi:hypothetical protein
MKMSACLITCIPVSHHTHPDLQTRRTLRMLYNEHTRAAKELQRRISALRAASLGPIDSPQRELGRNGSYSSDTDTEGSGRHRRALLSGRSKAQSPDCSSPTMVDDAHGPDAAKSSHLRQSVIDLRSEFDEIAEEGKCLFS